MDRITATVIRLLVLYSVLLTIATRTIRAADGTGAKPLALPTPHFDIATANIWTCTHSNDGFLSFRDLHDKGHLFQIEVLHSRTSGHVEVITPLDSTASLEALGLRDCNLLINMNDLVAAELVQNWANLQHHVGTNMDNEGINSDESSLKSEREPFEEHDVLKRSLNEGEEKNNNLCREGACHKEEVGLKEDGIKEMDMKDDKTMEEWFSQYHNLSAIYKWYLQLANDHPDIVSLNKTIGKSYYEREIIALHFSEKSEGKKREQRPKIYLQCLLHPREWITGSVCMYLSYRLASPHPTDTTLLELLKKVEFVIVPVANPDGYCATWLQYPKYRLWRKNVQPLNGTECAGADLNRNFNTHWDADTFSQSDDPCSELYHGSEAGSELEVQTITSYIKSLKRVIGAIDFHSYHQKVLYPPAYSGENVGNLDTIQRIAEEVATAASSGEQSYTPHNMYSIYSASGTFADWLLDYRNDDHYPDSNDLVPLTIELRPKATNDTTYVGFLLPTTEILPSCQEMFSAFITFAQLALNESENPNSH